MIVDRSDIQPIFMKCHSVVEELHTIHFTDFDVTNKFQKSIEPQTVVFNRFWANIFFILQIIRVLLEQRTDGGRGNGVFEKRFLR